MQSKKSNNQKINPSSWPRGAPHCTLQLDPALDFPLRLLAGLRLNRCPELALDCFADVALGRLAHLVRSLGADVGFEPRAEVGLDLRNLLRRGLKRLLLRRAFGGGGGHLGRLLGNLGGELGLEALPQLGLQGLAQLTLDLGPAVQHDHGGGL
jgi:hypothetical protein